MPMKNEGYEGQKGYHEFDPYSEESLRIVEEVEALPFNQAFEQLLYDNRIDRVTAFEYAHDNDIEYDATPLVIDHDVMQLRFPESLRGIFPDDQYTIEQLRIVQSEIGFGVAGSVLPQTTLAMSFWTHECEHFVTIKEGVATYETKNESLDDTSYTFEPEAIIGLIAAFVYAKQYDPEHPKQPIRLTQSSIEVFRDPRVAFVEQLIMTLGNFTGNSTIQTQAMFENAHGSPILATLVENESPLKSTISNQLVLNEIDETDDLTTSTETEVIQHIVNMSDTHTFEHVGQLRHYFAEQRSTVLSPFPLTSTEYIDPKRNHARWVSICASFLNAIKNPLSKKENELDINENEN